MPHRIWAQRTSPAFLSMLPGSIKPLRAIQGSHGIMAFSPGEPFTGSTSPGWTVLLAAGYLLKAPVFNWAYVWGGIFAIATAFTAALLSQSYFGKFKGAMIVAVLCIPEWHLAWAAFSGMEINLHE